MPKRIQRKRVKGWRMPANTVYVGRGSKWGNPYKGDPEQAVALFASRVAPGLDVSELRGKDLACWCRLGRPCHADILLQMANK